MRAVRSGKTPYGLLFREDLGDGPVAVLRVAPGVGDLVAPAAKLGVEIVDLAKGPVRQRKHGAGIGSVARDTLAQYPRLRATRLHEMLRQRGYPGSARQARLPRSREGSVFPSPGSARQTHAPGSPHGGPPRSPAVSRLWPGQRVGGSGTVVWCRPETR